MSAKLVEPLTKAADSIDFAVSDLQQGLKRATAVEAIILIGLIGALREAHTKTLALLAAVQSTENPT